MLSFELRVYKLRTKEALDFYMDQIYPRHLSSFPLLRIDTHGFWTAKEDVEPRFFVLAPMRRGKNPARVVRGCMQSTESTILIPSASSLLNDVTHSKVLCMEEFMMEVLNVVAIIVAGLMVGSELAIAAFVHPTLDKLPDDVHLAAASALARVLGRLMPVWYILVFLLTLAEVVIQWHQSGRLPIWIATSAVLWMLASLYSVIALVPINNRIKSTPPPDWKTYRRRWDLLHRWRVVLLTIAFAFLIVGLVSK
jgi:uncharacterized membrane protein